MARFHFSSGVLLVMLIFFAGCSSAVQKGQIVDREQAMGLNHNERFEMTNMDEVERTGTTWSRGFLQFFNIYPDLESIASDSNVIAFLNLKENGQKTILNIKYQFRPREVPKIGSEEMEAQKEFMRALLDEVWDSSDIFVVGNEPFIETRPEQQNQDLLDYYKEMAVLVKDYKEEKNSDTPIYLGAFTRLYDPERTTQLVDDFLEFIRTEDWIAGTDIHVHHINMAEMRTSLDYATTRLRDDQGLLITEFSLVWHWREHMYDFIPMELAETYEYDPEMHVYEYIEYTLRNPVSREEWITFLSKSPWFEERKNYLLESYEMFTEYPHFEVATYAYQTGFNYKLGQPFTENATPWLLNSLYALHNVERDPETGEFQFSYNWIDDFKTIQKQYSGND